MKKLRYITNAEQSAYMRQRKAECMARSPKNRAENWAADRLKTTGKKWKHQAVWGYRIFDFWCRELGCAVEIDGKNHKEDYDSYRDEYNFRRSAIVVLPKKI